MKRTVCMLCCVAAVHGQARNPRWQERLGSDPVYAATADRYLRASESLVAHLPDATHAPEKDNWQPVSDTCSALVNVYRLSGDPAYRDQARRIADWLVSSNDYLVAHRDPALPYLGWGPETRTGYFLCRDVGQYHADDLWDTASVARCLIKVSEIDPDPTRSKYFQRAKRIMDAWPFVDRRMADDGSYAAAGLRWYRKSCEPCENRYVKNTNVAIGEQWFRVFRLTHDPRDFERAVLVLHTQLWDILTHRNLAYSSYMTYVDRSDGSYTEQAAHNDRKVLHTARGKPDDAIRCGAKDDSCWNHLGYEGYATFNIQQLTRDIPSDRLPVRSTQDDIAKAIRLTMDAWHESKFGDPARFDWSGGGTVTHVTAYNCAMRFSTDPIFERACREALRHRTSSATVFYSLVPESLW
jgi:hypothetical protein